MDQSTHSPSLQPNLTSSNPYEILGLHPTATAQQIKVSYRKLALQHHPDRLSPHASLQEKEEAHESFTKIGHAFEILGDENRRREFDAQQQQQQQRQHNRRGFDRSSLFARHDSFFERQSAFMDEQFDFMDPFDLFNRFFSEEGNSSYNSHGRNTNETSSRVRSAFFDDDPFFNSDPFSGFGSSSIMSRHFGMMNEMNSMMQSHRSMFDNRMLGENSHYSSSSLSLGRGNSQSVSTCTRTTIVNGVRTTVTERTVVHPDGRVERHVETSSGGQRQQQQNEALPSSSSRRAIGYDDRRGRRR